MKKLTLATLIASSLAFASTAAFAETNANGAVGVITINGEVVETTCTVNGGGSGDLTVELPKVSKSLLQTPAQTAGDTTFTIKLTNCNPNSGDVRTYFYNNEDKISANGRLINVDTSGTKATNVTIQLATLRGNPIDVTKDIAGQGVPQDSISGGSANLSYLARYYAEGAATAGKVKGQVSYMIAYQ